MEASSILFAAGRGRRLVPLSDRVPKPAVPLLDVPLGLFSLARLLHSAPPVVVNLSHLPNVAATRLLAPLAQRELVEIVVEEPEAYGTGGTLKALEDRIGERIVTCNCDLLADLEPADLLARHFSLGTPVTAAVQLVERGADFELAPTSSRATRYIDRRRRRDAAGGRFLGMAVLERDALELIPEERPAGLAESVLLALANGGALGVHAHEGYALDVGTIPRYLQASLDLLTGRAPAPPVEPPGEIVEVEGGRAYVGPGARAAPDALGPGAVLLESSELEPGARLERAVVWPGETVPGGRVVSNCVWAFGRPLTTAEAQLPVTEER